jgi:ribosomal protein S10
MFVTISLQSKSLQSIKKFLTFLEKSCNDFNLVVFMKVQNKVTIRKGVTVLKSPHVNKTAQEQFEFFVFEPYTQKIQTVLEQFYLREVILIP